MMETIGQKLKAAREKQSLSAADVAKAIRIRTQYVEAIERNEFHKLIAPVYARGFIKLYAVCVQLDPTPLIRQFNRIETFSTPVAHPLVAQPAKPAPPDKKEILKKILRRARSLFALLARSAGRIRNIKIRLPEIKRPKIPELKIPQVPVKIWLALTAAVVVITVFLALSGRTASAPDYKIRLSSECRWLADPPEPYLNISVSRTQNKR